MLKPKTINPSFGSSSSDSKKLHMAKNSGFNAKNAFFPGKCRRYR